MGHNLFRILGMFFSINLFALRVSEITLPPANHYWNDAGETCYTNCWVVNSQPIPQTITVYHTYNVDPGVLAPPYALQPGGGITGLSVRSGSAEAGVWAQVIPMNNSIEWAYMNVFPNAAGKVSPRNIRVTIDENKGWVLGGCQFQYGNGQGGAGAAYLFNGGKPF